MFRIKGRHKPGDEEQNQRGKTVDNTYRLPLNEINGWKFRSLYSENIRRLESWLSDQS